MTQAIAVSVISGRYLPCGSLEGADWEHGYAGLPFLDIGARGGRQHVHGSPSVGYRLAPSFGNGMPQGARANDWQPPLPGMKRDVERVEAAPTAQPK
jgi:hypothetical protein